MENINIPEGVPVEVTHESETELEQLEGGVAPETVEEVEPEVQ